MVALTLTEASDYSLAEISQYGTITEQAAAMAEIFRRLGLSTDSARYSDLHHVDAYDNFLAGQGF
jgi:hypothetical protein